MRNIVLILLLFIKIVAFSQLQAGGGVNVGYRKTGVELQSYALDRLKLFAGLNINRFSSFSSEIGIGIGVFQVRNKHNLWINSSLKYKFANKTIIEKDDIFYVYNINNLNYWNIGGTYSFRFDHDKKDNFLLLEINLFYQYILNQIEIIPSSDNTQISNEYISDFERFYKSGIGLSVGIKYIW